MFCKARRMFEVLDLFHCLHGSFDHLPSPTIDKHAKQKQSMFHQQWFKTLFSYYFLFVSCRLFLKKEVRRSANYHFVYFFFHMRAFHFHGPFSQISIFPSLPPHLIIVISFEREEEAGGGGGGGEEDGQLSTCLTSCLFVSFLSTSGLVESGQSEPSFLRWAVNVWKAVWLMTCHQPGEKACY